MDIHNIQQRLAAFAREREWDQFHSPKNLAMALAGEAGELLEVFQWLTEEQSLNLQESADKMAAAREEVADVFLYLLRLCDKLGIDLELAVNDKIAINAHKYPIDRSKGTAAKYTEFKK